MTNYVIQNIRIVMNMLDVEILTNYPIGKIYFLPRIKHETTTKCRTSLFRLLEIN